jgi:mannose-6-phosphate isomerase-like protein (cupin superfamily)
MSMVEFFSEEILQEKPTQIVYKANELIDISDGAVTMKLVGRAHPSRAIAFLNEIYPPGADTGDEMLTHEGEETGILVEGRLELVVGLETFMLEAGDSYYFESTKPHRFRNPFDCAGATDQRSHAGEFLNKEAPCRYGEGTRSRLTDAQQDPFE